MTPDRASPDQTARRVDRAGLVIAFLLAALAAVLLWDASGLQSGAMYGVGPSAMPIVVAVGLGLLAIGNLIDALRALGNQVRFTVLPGRDHFILDMYEKEELYSWFLEHSLPMKSGQ